MKSSIVAAGALALTTAWAAPLSSDNSNQAAQPQYFVSKFDAGNGDGWLISPPGSSKSAAMKFYQNNSLMSGRKGSAWVIEFEEDVDAKQIKGMANVRNAFVDPPVSRPYAPTQPYTLSQRQPQQGFGVGGGSGSSGSLRSSATANVVPAGPATPARPAAPAVQAAIVPASQLTAVAPAAPAAPACQQLPGAQQLVPAALLAPAAQLSTLQGGASITGLIQQAGQLIGQQIGTSIGNVIGSTLEGVVTQYFPAPKAAGR